MIGQPVLEVVKGDEAVGRGGDVRVRPQKHLARLFLERREPSLGSLRGEPAAKIGGALVGVADQAQALIAIVVVEAYVTQPTRPSIRWWRRRPGALHTQTARVPPASLFPRVR